MEDNKLWFPYTQYDGRTAMRYIDLEAFRRRQQDKWWALGSRAKGAIWWAQSFHPKLSSLERKHVLICEGETDALAAVQSGAPYSWIWCIPGANTGSQELVNRLCETKHTYTLAFDNDDAGKAARQKFAWWAADRVGFNSIIFDDGVNDLRQQLQENPGFKYPTEKLVQTPIVTAAGKVPDGRPKKMTWAENREEKPDLQTVWSALSPRSKPLRKDGQGRAMRQAWCPLHDDGKKPAAWVGEDRWGCFVCDISSADVYELVGWVRGYAQPGQALTGDAFKQAQKEARLLS